MLFLPTFSCSTNILRRNLHFFGKSLRRGCVTLRNIGENIAFAGVKNAFRRSEVNDNAMTSNDVNIANCQKRKGGLQTKEPYNKQISSWKVSANGIFALGNQEFTHSFASLTRS